MTPQTPQISKLIAELLNILFLRRLRGAVADFAELDLEAPHDPALLDDPALGNLKMADEAQHQLVSRPFVELILTGVVVAVIFALGEVIADGIDPLAQGGDLLAQLVELHRYRLAIAVGHVAVVHDLSPQRL